MFTGLIEEVGFLHKRDNCDDSIRLTIQAQTILDDIHCGDSICVNGVCLTVSDYSETSFSADVMKVTLDCTTLGSIRLGSPINLERAMLATQRFGGHIVQGHVDGQATLSRRCQSQNWELFSFHLDSPDLYPYLVAKGSLAVNGTSLTLVDVGIDNNIPWFDVSLIPTTLEKTMFPSLELGEKVNIECDIFAKYIKNFLRMDSYNKIS